MDTIPAVKALVASRHGPVIAPLVAANCFNAATSFAVPVLRARWYWANNNDGHDPRTIFKSFQPGQIILIHQSYHHSKTKLAPPMAAVVEGAVLG